MFKAPINIIYIETKSQLGAPSAWTALQAALGAGLATAIIEVPERRSSTPLHRDFQGHQSAPPSDAHAAQSCFSDLLAEWRHAFETIMNKRWDLSENPYAKAWIMPGMILLHEDPLGWGVDTHAQDIESGSDLEMPNWAVLMPAPTSNHATISACAQIDLPHMAILTGALTEAARTEGHDDICPLAWNVGMPDPESLDIVEA